MNRKNTYIGIFVALSLLLTTVYSASTSQAAVEPVATLTYKTNGGGFRPDYGLYVAQYLAEIGIKVTVKVEEWIVFVGTLTVSYDFDLGFVGISGGGADPDPTGVYNENGSLNMYGINTDLPYGEENEDYIKEGVTIMDLAERQQHYYEWQELIIDKILPSVPFYSPRSYVANWANLDGYDNRWGTVDSFAYMSFDGLHDGQVSTDEFNIADAKWKDLNPLLQDDTSSSYITNLNTEPILQMTPGFEAIKTGLIEDWEQDETNEYIYKFTMRDNVFWNPSFNITNRDADSDDLIIGGTANGAYLMNGIKGEYSDGTNQQVTAKDAVFTYLAWANPITSEDPESFNWIKDIGIIGDPDTSLEFYIEIDGNPNTPENEGYAPFWPALTYRCLPEFFLNGTNTTVVQSSGGVPMIGLGSEILDTPQWQTYSTSVFGCGKFMLDYYVEGSVTVLTRSPFWMGIGAIDGTAQTVDIETINIRVIPDINSELAEFQAGKLDVMGMTSFPSVRKEMETDPAFEVQSALQGFLNYMGFNLRRPFVGGDDNYDFLTQAGYEEYTKALAVRKAIAYAVDREEINQVLHSGEYLISHSYIYPIQAYWYYNDITKYEHDLDTAIEWLDRAGYYKTSTDTTVPFGIIGVVAAVMSFVLVRRKKN